MNNWEAILIGIVEGLTEYLPVSSTGHIVLTQRLLGVAETEASVAYAICVQAGAIIAVLHLYWGRAMQLVSGALAYAGLRAKDEAGQRLLVNMVVAFLPAAVIGLLLDDLIESWLFGLWPIVTAWFFGGTAILLVAFFRRTHGGQHQGQSIDQLTWRAALVIGLLQCIAMWPGTSRSLVTIVGGVLVGLHLAAAVEFSFLLGVVTLLAATLYKMKDAGPVMLDAYPLLTMLIGVVAAWISAVVAVRWMVTYLQRHGMEIFGYYRVLLALAVGVALLAGWL